MKKRVVVLLVLVFVAVLLLGSGTQVSARGVRIAVSSLEYDCMTGFEEGGGMWEEGPMLYVRGILHTNPNVSDTPELAGLHSTVADGDINMVTGDTYIHGTSVWQPEGINGVWKGNWFFVAIPSKGINGGSGFLRGSGALRGKMLLVNIRDGEPDPVTLGQMCAGIGEPEGITITEGFIVEAGRGRLQPQPRVPFEEVK